MSALERFIGGFATSLATQNREDQQLNQQKELEMELYERRKKIDQRYEKNKSYEEVNGEVFEVYTSGEGVPLPHLRRKLPPSEQEEYKAKGLRAKASSVEDQDTISNYATDAATKRKREGILFDNSLENSRAQRNMYNRSGGGGRGNEPTEIPEMINDAMYKTRDILDTLYPLASGEGVDRAVNPAAAQQRMEIEQLLEEAIIAKGLKTSAEVQRELRMILQGSTGTPSIPKSLEGSRNTPGMGIAREYINKTVPKGQ